MILFFSTLSRLIFIKNLLTYCFATPKMFIIFCKTRVRAQNAILVIPYNSVVWSFKVKFYHTRGMYKRKQR